MIHSEELLMPVFLAMKGILSLSPGLCDTRPGSGRNWICIDLCQHMMGHGRMTGSDLLVSKLFRARHGFRACGKTPEHTRTGQCTTSELAEKYDSWRRRGRAALQGRVRRLNQRGFSPCGIFRY